MSLNSRGNLSWNDDVATGWSRSNFYAIFSVNRYAYCVWLLHKYEAHMKGLPICFSEVQVKNDVTDNNNKHFVTAFEGECRNIIELREHLKLCFLIILKVLEVLDSLECQKTRNSLQLPLGRYGQAWLPFWNYSYFVLLQPCLETFIRIYSGFLHSTVLLWTRMGSLGI